MDIAMEKFQDTFDPKPRKFIVWLFVVSSTIMFGGFTSYYLVFAASKGKGHGLVLPDAFIYSSIVIIASSITLFLASKALKKLNFGLQRNLLWVTVILAIVFGVMQFNAWGSMVRTGATLVGNNAAISFIYVVSGIHLLHIIAGVGLIINALAGSYKNIPPAKSQYRMEIASIFWHFIDILWIYLYVFLLLNR
ncbi:cytochrome c oxidase subunit 3 [Pedobacter zeae]|uniref:Cytochrome c oxidase subunit 3 n=1 Tax=Pedobacter zeae TaxID=1737356 RepID=A0A7W6KE50_9SPHI|nr:cytochrome c oxidase subunit 3 [Pedobacter zeae]MBB4110145.1 cytochrome c oxidase subunit 3 [Pedobacter zeae]GGH16295.1 cytochrome oxidase subunit III [Pedobacter zeae]